MITPVFKLTQDNDYLYVTIAAPNIRLAEAEIFYENNEFYFHAAPYYLRLELPGKVLPSEGGGGGVGAGGDLGNPQNASGNKKTNYDFERKELLVPLRKQQSGEHFANLDMLSRFLTGPKTPASRRLVEVLDSSSASVAINDDDEEYDWNIVQELSSGYHHHSGSLTGKEPYGFANSQSGVIERLGQEISYDLIDIREPGKKSRFQRRYERLREEEFNFSDDHYLADQFEEKQRSMIDDMINSKLAPWDNNWNHRTSGSGSEDQKSILSDEDRLRIIDKLPRREFLRYDVGTKKQLLLGVIDILYGYAYDLRSNQFEHTPESAWTLRKLSPTLSWFETWTELPETSSSSASSAGVNVRGPSHHHQGGGYHHRDGGGGGNAGGGGNSKDLEDLDHSSDLPCYVLLSCIRRALIYPLYRNWNFALKIAQDVIKIISEGRDAILKCFLDIHRLFNETGDNYYLLNDLYITDYCCWLQTLRPDRFDSLANYFLAKSSPLSSSSSSSFATPTSNNRRGGGGRHSHSHHHQHHQQQQQQRRHLQPFQDKIFKTNVKLYLDLLERAAEMAEEEEQERLHNSGNSSATTTTIDQLNQGIKSCLKLSKFDHPDSDDD